MNDSADTHSARYSLTDVLPHRPPMILIDDILSYDSTSGTIVATVTIRPAWQASWVAIELMAQTAAALAGIRDRAEGYDGAPRPGFLLGTRKLSLALDAFEVDKTYEIRATCIFSDHESASFECAIFADAQEVARATLNAYRPTNLAEFFTAQSVAHATDET